MIATLGDLIDDSTNSDEAEESKPAPDIVEAALSRAKARPGEAVMIGDTPYDDFPISGTSLVDSADQEWDPTFLPTEVGPQGNKVQLEPQGVPIPAGAPLALVRVGDGALVSNPGEVTTEVGPAPWAPSHRLVLVGLKAREIEAIRVRLIEAEQRGFTPLSREQMRAGIRDEMRRDGKIQNQRSRKRGP